MVNGWIKEVSLRGRSVATDEAIQAGVIKRLLQPFGLRNDKGIGISNDKGIGLRNDKGIGISNDSGKRASQ